VRPRIESGLNLLNRPGEFELIERYFAPLSGPGGFGLKDDAALIDVRDSRYLAITQDAIAVNIHFLADDPPETIARKALRINLSDLAAKGVVPQSFSMALGLPPDWDETWLSAFASGLADDCRQFDLTLSGGDTFHVNGGPLIAITAWGQIERAQYTTRMGARPGDHLFVTGEIGASALGLLVRQGKLALADSKIGEMLETSYLVPDPPVTFAPVIARFATASMDISDGFVGDLHKLAAASNVDFDCAVNQIPLIGAVDFVEDKRAAINAALTGGDDYQILFTIPEDLLQQFSQAALQTGIACAELCIAREGSGNVRIVDHQNHAMTFKRESWTHF
jgi:thiamine-monophosphate kinase